MGRTLRIGVIDSLSLSSARAAVGSGSAALPVPDLRVSAVTPASQQMLQAIGAWALVDERRIKPYRHMQVWDGEGSGCMQFSADTRVQRSVAPLPRTAETAEGTAPLGYIVENNQLQAALEQRMQALAAAGSSGCLDILTPFSVVDLTAMPGSVASPATATTSPAWHREWVHATLAAPAPAPGTPARPSADASRAAAPSARQVRARLVIGADGPASAVRQLANIGAHGTDYLQQLRVPALVRRNVNLLSVLIE